MDYSKIVLLSEEQALLKRLVKHSPQTISPEEEHIAVSLSLKWGLINPADVRQYSANKDGKRYLVYCKAHRRELWLKNMWIPILVSLVTNLILAALRWLLPQILQ